MSLPVFVVVLVNWVGWIIQKLISFDGVLHFLRLCVVDVYHLNFVIIWVSSVGACFATSRCHIFLGVHKLWRGALDVRDVVAATLLDLIKFMRRLLSREW